MVKPRKRKRKEFESSASESGTATYQALAKRARTMGSAARNIFKSPGDPLSPESLELSEDPSLAKDLESVEAPDLAEDLGLVAGSELSEGPGLEEGLELAEGLRPEARTPGFTFDELSSKVARGKKAFGDFWRGLSPGDDELFSTSATREFLTGFFEDELDGPLTADETALMNEVVDQISSARIPTRYSGFATKDRVMQHPTKSRSGFFCRRPRYGQCPQ